MGSKAPDYSSSASSLFNPPSPEAPDQQEISVRVRYSPPPPSPIAGLIPHPEMAAVAATPH